MGMYTELSIAVELKGDLAPEIAHDLWVMAGRPSDTVMPDGMDTLVSMFGSQEIVTKELKELEYLFGSRHQSYPWTGSNKGYFSYDKYGKSYDFSVRGCIKNYGSYYQQFLDWLEPYVFSDFYENPEDYEYESGEEYIPVKWMGTYWYEEANMPSSLFHFPVEHEIRILSPKEAAEIYESY